MKILQVIPYFTPRKGGDVNVLFNLSKKLVKRGHEVTIITTDSEFDEEYSKSIEKENVRVIPFQCIINIYLLLYSPSMKKWLRDNITNFDIVHLHDFRSYQNIISHYYARKYHIPYVLQPHGSTPRIVGIKILKWLFDIVFGYKILKDASKVIAVSNEEAEHDKKMGAIDEKIYVIYNGINLELFKNLPEYGKFKEKYGIKGKMILYLGRINKTKGIDFSIKAFAELIKEIDIDVVFVIVGPDDGYKAELEKLTKKLDISDKIKFFDYVNEKDKVAAYVDADLFVHTVLYMGGVGLAPLEAILCNNPIIVTEECGEIIKKANAGYIVKYGDVNGLRETLNYALCNPEEGEKRVSRGKKYIEMNFSWDTIIQRVEAVYEECVSKSIIYK